MNEIRAYLPGDVASGELDQSVEPALDVVLAALVSVIVHPDGGVAERSSEAGDVAWSADGLRPGDWVDLDVEARHA